jgi:hypothetical protein
LAVSLVLILVGGTLVLLAVILVPIFVLVRRHMRRVAARIAADLASEPPVRGPESALYRGGTGSYPKVSGNGKLLLTSRRLIFRIAIGTDVVLALVEIEEVRESRVWLRSVRGGSTHVVVRTPAGEAGFIVDDTAGWIAAIESAAPARR